MKRKQKKIKKERLLLASSSFKSVRISPVLRHLIPKRSTGGHFSLRQRDGGFPYRASPAPKFMKRIIHARVASVILVQGSTNIISSHVYRVVHSPSLSMPLHFPNATPALHRPFSATSDPTTCRFYLSTATSDRQTFVRHNGPKVQCFEFYTLVLSPPLPLQP